MKKTIVVCGLVGMAMIFAGCSSTKEVKEVKIIHEHHIYVYNVHPRMNPRTRQMSMKRNNPRFNQSKGIDPRYDHKPGQARSGKKLDQSKGGVDPRYDHKPGMMPPKKKPTVSE